MAQTLHMNLNYDHNFNQLALKIKQLGIEIGFNQVGITDLDLTREFDHFKTWVQSGSHGEMKYFEKHGDLYRYPQKLLPTTTRVIGCAACYPRTNSHAHPIASFAQTQDYSHYIRQLLKQYADKISQLTKTAKTKVFAGNAPLLEKALAAKAGIGWYGKNSLLLNPSLGSYFFLGEILINLPLPKDQPLTNHCGSCRKCQDCCPTQALVAPYQLNANRCISYLTIEHKGAIPLELRPLIGSKIFGCDTCQQACPWNNQKQRQATTFFMPSSNFIPVDLINWFLWDEKEFLAKTQNSPITRLGHERWLRNLAVALGNLLIAKNNKESAKITNALQLRLNHSSALVREHVEWSLNRRYQ